MAGSTEDQVATFKKLLDQELDRQIGPQIGCWPLAVGVAGVLLGVWLLLDRL